MFKISRFDLIKLAQDLLVLIESEGTQENCPQKLALAVDPNVEDVFLIVFKLHPTATVWNDLGKVGCPVIGSVGFEEDTG